MGAPDGNRSGLNLMGVLLLLTAACCYMHVYSLFLVHKSVINWPHQVHKQPPVSLASGTLR